jgi:hypothetical protein
MLNNDHKRLGMATQSDHCPVLPSLAITLEGSRMAGKTIDIILIWRRKKRITREQPVD